MRRIFLQFVTAMALTAIAITASLAHTHKHAVMAGDLEISASWARAMLPNQPAGGGYLTITNKGSEADALVSATSPVSGRVEIHTMEIINDVMTMRPVDGGLEIPAGATVELKPGGLHLMFMEVSDSFDEGETVKVTLQFERAGAVEVELPVQKGAGGGHTGHGDHKMDVEQGSLPDQDAIKTVLKKTWDKPDAPLMIEPVVIEGDYAIAGWMQNQSGGRALLRRHNGQWSVHLCTGDAVKSASNLEQMGLPPATAATLAAALEHAEGRMDATHVALLSTFDGTVMMDEHGNH